MIQIGNLSQPARPKSRGTASFAAALIATLSLASCGLPTAVKDALQKPGPEKPAIATFQQLAFSDLEGWNADDLPAALESFQDSCRVILTKSPNTAMGGEPIYGAVADWRPTCQKALTTKAQARDFFETQFAPVQIFGDGEPVGLFTGYYEPELRGSRTRTGPYQTPLYRRPNDLVMVDLGEFKDALKGERIAGRVMDGTLKPYAKREEIVTKGLGATSAPIVYVDSAWDAFSLQIQGSGRVRMADGTMIRVNYDGQNGHPYTPIGKNLVARGEIRREDISMQSIQAWLEKHPKQAADVMNLNASYVFFKEEPGGDPKQGAPGAMKVPLHPERSLAVDLRYHALGAPLWVDATRPPDKKGADQETYRHLLIAQDTGGAIRGPVRGDVYWGAGAHPAEMAGRMANRGRLIILLPRALAAKISTAAPNAKP